MEIWHGILLGVVQGATEFFPVSSSGHLLIVEIWLGLKPDINFSILLHVATLLAVVTVFAKDLKKLLFEGGNLRAVRQGNLSMDGRLAWQLLVATVATVIVALVIEPYFEALLDLVWVGATLIATGGLIWGAEKFRRGELMNMSWGLALLLGMVQGLAVIPGISRSGLTIAFLVLVGLNRQLALRVSFLLSIPTILGALVFMLKDQWGSFSFGIPALLGFIASFVVALASILLMRQLVEKHWLWFAPYCFLLGIGLIIFNLLAA